MATDFQTKEVQNLGTVFENLTGAFTSGEATVHAIYITNKNSATRYFYMSLFDNQSPTSVEKASVLHNVEIPGYSTLVIEKPINLTASNTDTTQRKLMVKASDTNSIDGVASVLVIT